MVAMQVLSSRNMSIDTVRDGGLTAVLMARIARSAGILTFLDRGNGLGVLPARLEAGGGQRGGGGQEGAGNERTHLKGY